MATHSLLKDIHDGSDMWSIIVRVMRKWNVYQKSSPNELFCVSMLLIDAEGNKIQGSIITKSMHEKYNQGIKERKTYEFENFIVSPNSYKYRPTTHPFKITFTAHTYFSEEVADLPLYSYTLKPIADIIAMPDEETVEHLIDVLGFVKSMGSPDDFDNEGGTKSFLRMVLCDAEDNEIECVLFGQCASDAYLAQMQNIDTPVVALINLARISWTEDKHRQIASSFAATRVYFNHSIREVQELIDSVKDRSTPIAMEFSQSMPTQRSRVSGGDSLHGQNKVTIDKIGEQTMGDAFVVGCELTKFETKFGWIYDGCSKCSSKPKPLNDKDPKSPLYCPGCKKAPNKVEPKMKLTFIVKDETGMASVTFWDNLAVQLVGKTAIQMKLELPERKRSEGFPADLKDQVGKKLLVKLKLNKYNKDNPGSSISAYEFTVCGDLLQEFNSATSEVVEECIAESTKVLQAPPINDARQKGLTESSVTDSTNHTVDLSEEETTTTNLSQHITHTHSKGKRRMMAAARVHKNNTQADVQQTTSIRADERMLKTVKQEK